METKLQVNDLRISFRTSNGKVQAVRGINFTLHKGETLAIVGESGSGKSVTSKAILGIQAGNAINESGEIIYDGKDLLKITEEDFHKIRGDKIAMIFQDPMSSLNPIVRIGKQLTEAMILKGKARQRESRNNFNTYLKNLNKAMIAAIGSDKSAELTEKCKKFDKFEFKHIELESAYNKAREAAEQAVESIDVISFEMEKNAVKDAAYRVKTIATLCKESVNDYVVSDKADRLVQLSKGMSKDLKAAKNGDYSRILASLAEAKEIMAEGLSHKAPNFFRMGYYLTYSGKELPKMDVEQLDAFLLDYLDKEFMLGFLADSKKALQYTADVYYKQVEEAIAVLEEGRATFAKDKLVKKECKETAKKLSRKVMDTVDPLWLAKDSLTYTFHRSMDDEIERYFAAIGKNAKAMRTYNKEKRKYDNLVKRGKTPDYEVAAAAVTDLEMVKGNIDHLIVRLIDHYKQSLENRSNRDFDAETVAAVDYLKANASGVVAKVTRAVAKSRAIKLMEEVGIPDPRRRYSQYPFEFSGGMRQRIVIAIALAANPDILICDEPTTALDVTIQSQILELINKLKRERQLSVIFITHDLGVVANMADRVAVMYAGKIVEIGTANDIFYDPKHPYTWALLSSMPDLDTEERLEAIPGTPPNMIYPPKGDAFAARNKYAMKIDFEEQPPMFQVSDTHYAATWLLHPDAPKVDPPKIIRDRIARMNAKRGAEHE